MGIPKESLQNESSVLTKNNSAGFTVRRLLPVFLLLPLFIGWIQLKGQQAGLALMVTSCAIILTVLALWSTFSLGLIDEGRQQSLRDERFLFDLSEQLRSLTKPAETLYEVAKKLGEYLGVSRCLFMEIDLVRDAAITHNDYHDGTLSSLVGILPLSLFSPENLEASKAGRTITVEDYSTDPRTSHLYEKSYRPHGMRAGVAVPLLRDKRWVSTLLVSKSEAYVWQARELNLIQLVCEKAWLWFEHARESKALVESEARYRDLYEHSPDMYASLDATADAIIDCNHTLLKMLGYPREEIMGKPLVEFYDSSSHSAMRVVSLAFRESGEAHGTALKLTKKDGSSLEVSLDLSAVRDDRGQIISCRAVLRDITSLRQLERMQERDRFFQLSTDMVCISKDGYFKQINPAFEKILGYSSEELLSRPTHSFIYPDDRPSAEQERQRLAAASSASPSNFTNRLLCKDGSFRWLQWRSTMDQDGARYAIARDITKEKEAEELLRLNEERFRLLIEGVKDYAIFMLDPQGLVSTWNSGAERLKGYASAEILGKHFSIFYTQEEREGPHPKEELRRAEVEGHYEEEGWRVRKDGSMFWASTVISPLWALDGTLRGFGKVTQDFTERRRAEQELQKKQADLSTSLREREVLLQEVHHRVKNNLQIVSSLINMQMRQLKDPTSRSALLECKSRIETIALIHENLYRSRNYANVQFSAYIKELISNIFHATGVSLENIEFTINIEDTPLSVDKAIPCGLILNELITNAVKHAFPEGRGVLRVELKKLNEKDILLAVSDNGVGLPPQFEIGKSKSLGMILVSTLAGQLDGRLEIARDNGTSFQITFPLETKQ
jgi:PAS domain S-box-containing protein